MTIGHVAAGFSLRISAHSRGGGRRSGFGVTLHGELHGELVEPLSNHQPNGVGA